MRQFILGAADVAYATGATPELAASGAVGFIILKMVNSLLVLQVLK